jgi:transcriptional regulator with XRE-family HTH domain
MTFGEKLKELRMFARWTQIQLADESGVPLGTIRDYEQGKRDPLLSTAQKLAHALGQPLDVFSFVQVPKGKSQTKRSTPKRDTKKGRK